MYLSCRPLVKQRSQRFVRNASGARCRALLCPVRAGPSPTRWPREAPVRARGVASGVLAGLLWFGALSCAPAERGATPGPAGALATGAGAGPAFADPCARRWRAYADAELVELLPGGAPGARIACGPRVRCALGGPGVALLPDGRGGHELRLGEQRYAFRGSDRHPVGQPPFSGVALGGGGGVWATGDALLLFRPPDATLHRVPWPAGWPAERRIEAGYLHGGAVGVTWVPRERSCALPRLHLLLPPAEPWPAPAGAQLVLSRGALQGFVDTRGEEAWLFSPAGAPLFSLGPAELPLERVIAGEGFWLWQQHGQLRVRDDAGRVRVIASGANGGVVQVGRHLLRADPEHGIARVGAHAETPLHPTGAGVDLGGRRMPAGSTRIRLQIAHDDRERMLVLERWRLPDCREAETLYEAALPAAVFRPLPPAGPERARLHPLYAGDRFYFVEAEASYRELALTD